MSRPRPITGLLVAAILLLAVLPVAYMGAYYAMLEDRVGVVELQYGVTQVTGGVVFIRPIYRSDDDWVKEMFDPANKIDRWIRPRYWGLTDIPKPIPPPPPPF